jgi:hypothetical protein
MMTVRPMYNLYDEVLSVDSISIWKRYIPEIELDRNISSPLRYGDSDPSFRIYQTSKGLKFIDFGTGNKGSIIDLVQQLKGISSLDACKDILGNDYRPSIIMSNTHIPKKERKSKTVLVKTRIPDKEDLRIWNEWGITPDTLIRFNVHPVEKVWLKGDNGLMMIPCKTRSYGYAFPDGWKIYRPFEKTMRFISGIKEHQGIHLLPDKGEILVIQKSYKDVMFMYECGFYSFAPNSESIIVTDELINSIRPKFKYIFIWGDNDEQGKKFCTKHSERHGIIPLFNDDDCKDPTDSCKKYGKTYAMEMVNRIIENGITQ